MKTLEDFVLFINPANLYKRGFTDDSVWAIWCAYEEFMKREIEIYREERLRIIRQEKEKAEEA